METKAVALDKVVQEVEWLKRFINCIPLRPKLVTIIGRQYDSMISSHYNTKSNI